MRRIIDIRRVARIAAICTAGLAAGTAAAQDEYTADDLLDLFEKQRAAYDEVRTRGLGQTRGLKLVTLEDVDPGAAETQAAEDGAAGGGASVAAGDDEPATYGQFADELQINFQIEFGFDSAALAESEKPKLATMCEALKASPVELVRIVGHTDAAGTDAYNERLSVLRAEEVERHLVEECGIDASRLETMGLGERFPRNADNPRADENRRVEFQALS